jgi:4-hydroxythreonine-4-phosphate dehydrogenase
MKIYVTQGHEKGIGTEVFIKSCLLLTKEELNKIHFLAFRESLKITLDSLNIPWRIDESSLKIAETTIRVSWLSKKTFSESYSALLHGIDLCADKNNILFTLPTSKDQFPGFPGHTEFFRSHFNNEDLGMFFSSPDLQVLLLSDHVPVSRLGELITEDLVYQRLKVALRSLKLWRWPIGRVLISGLNPHAGEGGLIGSEDSRIKFAINRLRGELKIDMSGPYSGDTMLLEKGSVNDLLVYTFHDQGLGAFKGLQGFVGSNITLGLPFLRFSPDHGTSFGLYGRNVADYRGCSFALKQALHKLKEVAVYGKNPGHQGKSSQSKRY